ncbi:MAG TPA: DUF6497 family protein [Roseovarius sp.]
MDQGRSVCPRAGNRYRRALGDEQGSAYRSVAQPLTGALRRAIWAAFAVICAVAPAAAGAVLLPSGGQANLYEVITEGGGDNTVTRLRFVTDGFSPDQMAPDVTLNDMTFLCENMALTRPDAPAEGQTVIISLADRPAPLGVIDSSIAQVFEVFTIVDDTCIWEPL